MEKEKLLSFLAILLLISFSAQAEDVHQQAVELFQHSEQLKTLYQKEALELLRQSEELKKPYENEVKQLHERSQQIIQKYLKKEAQKENIAISNEDNNNAVEPNASKKFLVFVSLSMPKPSLKALYQETQKQNIPLILRGLKNNSFKETTELLKDLEIAVEINPELFRKYQITRTPSFVLIKEQAFHQLSGNISLGYARNKLMELQ